MKAIILLLLDRLRGAYHLDQSAFPLASGLLCFGHPLPEYTCIGRDVGTRTPRSCDANIL